MSITIAINLVLFSAVHSPFLALGLMLPSSVLFFFFGVGVFFGLAFDLVVEDGGDGVIFGLISPEVTWESDEMWEAERFIVLVMFVVSGWYRLTMSEFEDHSR